MDKEEQLRFLRDAREIVEKIKAWSQTRDHYTKEELELVKQLKVMLEELKKMTQKL